MIYLIRILYISIHISIATVSNAQLVNIPIIVTDGTTNGKDTLRFGLDPSASDGIDTNLGETELPPIPPSGIFDVRFIGTNLTPPLQFGQGIKRDYRAGGANFVGIKTHQIKFQRSNNYNNITINYNLPSGVTGRVFDLFGGVVVYDSIHGSGNITISNTGLSTVLMRINYNLGSVGINNITNLIYEDIFLCNYPNPFNSETRIKYQITKNCYVKLTLIDILGIEIKIVINENKKAGYYEEKLNLREYVSGIYFIRIESGTFIKTRKLLLIK